MRNTPSILSLVSRTSAAALALLAAGCVNELSAHPYAHAHDHQELTATPLDARRRVARVTSSRCSATPAPTPPGTPPETSGASCAHSFGGNYADRACSSGYQCCDGSWSVRGACGACVCVETSGERGCGGDAPAPSDPVYHGLSLAGSEIPRAGIANRTLESTLGVAVEPLGTVVTFEGQRYVRA